MITQTKRNQIRRRIHNRIREKLAESQEPRDAPIRHLQWAYPTQGELLEPSAEAVLRETLPADKELDDIPVMQLLLSRDRLIGSRIRGRFLDAGLPDGYAEANELLATKSP